MPALVAGIHVFQSMSRIKDVDGRVKPGHDVERAPIVNQSRAPPGWPTVASEVVDLLGDGDGTF